MEERDYRRIGEATYRIAKHFTENAEKRTRMVAILIVIGITICLVAIGALGALLLNDDGSTPQVAIVAEKFEAQGMHFLKVIVPVDEDLYVGLDVGDEVTLENESKKRSAIAL